jgi:hypothetical protein
MTTIAIKDSPKGKVSFSFSVGHPAEGKGAQAGALVTASMIVGSESYPSETTPLRIPQGRAIGKVGSLMASITDAQADEITTAVIAAKEDYNKDHSIGPYSAVAEGDEESHRMAAQFSKEG